MPIITELQWDIGPIPLLWTAGVPCRSAFGWLAYRFKQGLAQGTLMVEAQAVGLLYEVWRYHSGLEAKEVLGAFWKAIRLGEPSELRWCKVSPRVARQYVNAVNGFLDWGAAACGKANPNPAKKYRMTWWEQLAAMDRVTRTELLAHLFITTKRGRGIRTGREEEPWRKDGKRLRARAGKRVNPFDYRHYLKLLQYERIPRNLCLRLTFGAGGRRLSEALNLFSSDVRFDETSGEARIILSDPNSGKVLVPDTTGRELEIDRVDYLRDHYGLVPRNSLPRTHRLWAGWKGMAFDDDSLYWAEVLWMAPIFGRMFWKAYLLYLQERIHVGQDNPWLYVNLTRGKIGAPLTRIAVQKCFEATCKRLGIPGPYGPHRLRHMYGNWLEQVCGLKLQEVNYAMGHMALSSTAIYSGPTQEQIRSILSEVQKSQAAELNSLADTILKDFSQ